MSCHNIRNVLFQSQHLLRNEECQWQESLCINSDPIWDPFKDCIVKKICSTVWIMAPA